MRRAVTEACLVAAILCLVLEAPPSAAQPAPATCPCFAAEDLTPAPFFGSCQALGSWTAGYLDYIGWPFFSAQVWMSFCWFTSPFAPNAFAPLTSAEYDACATEIIDAATAAGTPCACSPQAHTSAACTVVGELGVCAEGATACSSGAVVCEPLNSPSAEVCDDQLDNDCNGLVDEADPACSLCNPSLCVNVSSFIPTDQCELNACTTELGTCDLQRSDCNGTGGKLFDVTCGTCRSAFGTFKGWRRNAP